MLERLAGCELLLGIDRNPDCLSSARIRLQGKAGVDLREVDVLSPGFNSLAVNNPDTVLFVNTLENISDDLLALRQAGTVLGKGGKLVILASAIPFLSGELDRAHAQRRYTRASLTGLMESAGFRVESARYMNFLGLFGWWFDSRFQGKREMSASAYRNRDRMVPLARAFDALTGPPIGSTLLAVGIRE